MPLQPQNLTLDQLSQPEIDNGEIASYQLLKGIHDKQHSLATGYYGAPVWYYLGGLNNYNGAVHYNVPPLVTKVALLIYACGDGTITATTQTEAHVAIDSTGSEVIVNTGASATNSVGPLKAVPFYMNNGTPGAAADEARTLTIVSSSAFTWQTSVIKIATPPDVFCFGVAVVPIHVVV